MGRREKKRQNRIAGRRPTGNNTSGSTSAKEAPALRTADAVQAPPAGPPLSRRKRWAFRILAAVGIPILLFAIVETALRAFGVGYPTGFYLRAAQNDRPVLIDNPQFGWRYFGPAIARTPNAFSVDENKPDNTVRIIVFGESAAYGDPQSDFGLPRMLSAQLSARYPGKTFEVVNAAMTAINSHTIREIAQDSVAADADAWVIYMGNNEVVGPFGAGTVFGSQAPPLSVVRATLALKSTRTGQLLDGLLGRIRRSSADEEQWGGMMMFVDHQVRQDEPQLQTVYHHFRQNLEEIIEIGNSNGIGVVVSTVAANLRDCAPFASDWSAKLSNEQRNEWTSLYEKGVEKLEAGNAAEAVAHFESAARLDANVANLQFRWGQAALGMNDPVEAGRRFRSAADCDMLRFRCDSRLNDIIRETAANRSAENIGFVDAASGFQKDGPSGKELFYDHVHFTFDGTYLLARMLAEEVERQMPQLTAEIADAAPWPTRDECAKRLGWSEWILRLSLADMLVRMSDPPFTAQLNHDQQVRDIKREIKEYEWATKPEALKEAAEFTRQAIQATPDDHVLYSQLDVLLANTGDMEGARQAAERAAELLPHHAAKWHQLGLAYAQQRKDDEAVAAFYKALDRDPRHVHAMNDLAKSMLRLDRTPDAIKTLQTAIDVDPRFGVSYYTLGAVYEDQGRTLEAEAMYRSAIRHPPDQTADQAQLARVCEVRGWYEDALAIYRKAIAQSAEDPAMHLGAAMCLSNLGQQAEAREEFHKVIELAPNEPEPRHIWAAHLARQGQHAEAVEHFSATLRLNSNLSKARIDLGVSLLALDRTAEALREFNTVLRDDPSNEIARRYATMLEAQRPQR